jgi:RNA polymerase sigma factor (sigma-70 family)
MSRNSDCSDAALVSRVLSSDRVATTEFVKRHEKICWSIIFRIVKHSEDANELCQEAMIRAFTHLAQFRGDSSLRSWIGRIAYVTALRHLEKAREFVDYEPSQDIFDTLASSDDGPEQIAQTLQQDELVRRLVSQLTPEKRTIVNLFYYEELPLAEISAIVNLPVGTIKSHLSRIRERLKNMMEST